MKIWQFFYSSKKNGNKQQYFKMYGKDKAFEAFELFDVNIQVREKPV